jgi:Mn2+/Fe2+ NRAMP family transporter
MSAPPNRRSEIRHGARQAQQEWQQLTRLLVVASANGIRVTARSRLLRALGPGLITGASDDDPSGITAYSQAGAQFGFAISWTMLFSYPLMVAIQQISAQIGRTTGRALPETSGSIMLMHMTANRKIMREFKVNGGLMIVGWIATAVMAGAATAMCFTTALSVIEM